MKKKCFALQRLLVLTMACCCMLLFSTAYATEDLDTRSLALINKPGVILIQSTWSADVTVEELDVDSAIFDAIDTALDQLANEGKLTGAMDQLTSAYLQIFAQFLPQFVYPSGNIISNYTESSFIGTGFIVTPDGYLLTNAHVVETDEETLYMNFAYNTLADYVTQAVQNFEQSLFELTGVHAAQEDIDFLAQSFYSVLAQGMQVSNLSVEYLGFMGSVTQGSDAGTKAVKLDLRKKGEGIPGKDVAILKLDKTNLPTVTLGDDSFIKTGDSVYAMGYPAVATVNGTFNVEQAIQEPTLTSGLISAKKQMAGGWSILQTSADIHGGNSGGPLFNAAGEVIGINTFGMLEDSGASASGMNFAVPISIARQFLNELNITPSESQFTTEYKKAVVLYTAKDYRGAAQLLRKINEISPGIPVVVELLSECSSLEGTSPIPNTSSSDSSSVVSSGSTKSLVIKSSQLFTVGIVVGVLVLFVIITIGIILAKKRSRSKVPLQKTVQPISTLPTRSIDTTAEIICPTCGSKNQNNQKFCGGCGIKL